MLECCLIKIIAKYDKANVLMLIDCYEEKGSLINTYGSQPRMEFGFYSSRRLIHQLYSFIVFVSSSTLTYHSMPSSSGTVHMSLLVCCIAPGTPFAKMD